MKMICKNCQYYNSLTDLNGYCKKKGITMYKKDMCIEFESSKLLKLSIATIAILFIGLCIIVIECKF